MNGRVDRLRASLEEPLLVSAPANVRYLAGFVSSNAALVVERERVRLFADFRYAEAGRAVEGVEFVETGRALFADLAELLDGRIAFEADDLSYSSYETLAGGGLELVPRRGVVEELRAVKDDAELDAMRRAARIGDEAFARLATEPFVGRAERDLAWRMQELFHELRADRAAFPTIVAAGANGALPHAHPGDRAVEPGDVV
ncbi:MAG: aminopeptidase P family N-terminal domain-containing protein, partial [Actinomycetota bacterium]|nr:aminopeptidase P family N-terminal domain-containing protein [Actinomycetota bacterium]